MSNHPPDIELGLTREQAQFLMNNCDTNIEFALKAMLTLQSREAAMEMVALMEQFKAIRALLRAQGIESE